MLWEIAHDEPLRFRCHTGHAFTAPVLLAEQTGKIEETLWVALRMLEERRNLLIKMSRQPASRRGKRNGGGAHQGNAGIYASAAERAKESEAHINRIRTMLRESEQATAHKRMRA
ncbi:MAG: hypothetical protein LC624_07725 [Halobacteriales archaeon]|nr:hypothetical protein [Halobacteriales archaeon]